LIAKALRRRQHERQLASGCTDETEAFIELLQAVQGSRDLVEILEGAQVRLLVALSRAITEPVQL